MLPPQALWHHNPSPQRVLDMASAPGSKATQMSALMKNRGLLVANELSASRIKVLAANFQRMGVANVAISHFDGNVFGQWLPETFDSVLLDAPCSGEGVIRKDPLAMANWSPESIGSIAQIQKQLIDSAFRALKPGGVLVYSTCTLSPEENHEIEILSGAFMWMRRSVLEEIGYLDETYEDPAFEKAALETLKQEIKSKRVGQTGYIYCMTRQGALTIHPDAEGQNIMTMRDSQNRAFIAEMVYNKEGWIRYPWKNQGEEKPRMKIVRYRYFEPWDWIVAVGSYEDEFYQPANQLKWRIAMHVLLLPLVIGLIAAALVFLAAKVLTEPINNMITVIRRVRQGKLDEQVPVESTDELGELAIAFNRMTRMLRRNKEMEAALAQQGKMASLGVLSSGVAHEINNPLGVILGYAGYLEKKIPESDPNFTFIHEIKRESKRCKKIVQDLLSYARTPKPVLEATDINRLLRQIIEFAANHTDLNQVEIIQEFTPQLPQVPADGDQLRQIAINLLLNAGAAMPQGGKIRVATMLEEEKWLRVEFADNGEGIPEENLEKIFEPFFTTKSRGTGLGLAITRQIIDMHQGGISIDSEVGKGTTVVIRFPLEREEY